MTSAPRTKNKGWRSRLVGLAAIAGLATAGLVVGTAGTAQAAVWNAGLVSGGPTLTVVSSGSSLLPGSIVTVTGTGFTESPEGVYVGFGSVDEAGWRPSAGAASTTRSTRQPVWISDDADTSQPGQFHWNTTTTGKFAFTLLIEKPYAAVATYFHVYAENAHGKPLAANEQAVRVNYIGTTDPTPTYTGNGYISNVTANADDTWTIDGVDYPLTPSTGVYVSIGTLADAGWQPSGGFGASTRAASDTVWAYPAGPDPQSGITAQIRPNGTFSVTVDPSLLPASAGTGRHFAAYTIGAHGVVVVGAEDEETTLPPH